MKISKLVLAYSFFIASFAGVYTAGQKKYAAQRQEGYIEKLEQARQRTDSIFAASGLCGKEAWDSWMDRFSDPLPDRSMHSLLLRINFMANDRLLPKIDAENYGQSEYFASPVESLLKGYGDCEDYALLKAATCIDLGMDPKSISILAVGPKGSGSANHAVCKIVLPNDKGGKTAFVLDNILRYPVTLEQALETYSIHAEVPLKNYKRYQDTIEKKITFQKLDPPKAFK